MSAAIGQREHSRLRFPFARQREDHEQAARRELLLRPHVKVPITTMCDRAEVLRSSKGAPAGYAMGAGG
jgi:hypothetical protein